ncbi:LIF receptor subunit alpha a isoform X2 [Chiloscyllium plagiosum]|uniref:LIF receptor subunit alpha a isoform X2 n=1 Tax=Chiloscyllium plagiosum TaxID=36176 RepID=UPI001CB843B3|nr:LIF receptor subunit alpha a isoform X2 [Chiloscyllium plagiosum]
MEARYEEQKKTFLQKEWYRLNCFSTFKSQCGSISTKNLVASVNSSYNITCYFCEFGAADQVKWKYAGNLLPSSYYTKITSNVSMVSLNNLGLTSQQGENLTCTFKTESYTTSVKTGYPPEAPRDLECVTQNFGKLKCSWRTGRDTNIETNYTVCSWLGDTCTEVGAKTFIERDFVAFQDLQLQITATNELGKQTSEKFRKVESDIVFQPYTPELLRVFKGLTDFQLTVEWNEGGTKYGVGLKLIFEIQIIHTHTMREVWRGNYSSALDFSRDRILQFNWTSDMPLQCTAHSVRIRAISGESEVLFSGVKAWSDWSLVLTLEGLDTFNQTKGQVYPVDGTVLKAGSSLTFCCVAGQGKKIDEFLFSDLNASVIELSDRSQAVKVQNVTPSIESGTNVLCIINKKEYEGAVIFIGYPPDLPRNLSCETRDLKTLNCTWEPGRSTSLVSKRRTIYTLIDRSSEITLPCEEASKIYPSYWCSFPISNGSGVYNLSVYGKNPLGEAQSHITVDVISVFHPYAPHQLSEEAKILRSINVSWSDPVDYTGISLLCEMNIRDHLGSNMSYNYSVLGGPVDASHVVTLDNLRPNTRYSIQARYSAQHFWKWSKWSNLLNFLTEQAAPSTSLNVWRKIMPNRTVMIYWKPLSDAEANGQVLSYNITWMKIGSNLSTTVERSTSGVAIDLDQAAYIITVIAQNSAGTSPPSVVRIPAHTNDEHLGDFKAIGVGDGFHVTWLRHQVESCGYTVEWCEVLSYSACNISWQKFPSNVTGAIIKSDDFQVGVRYMLEVHECRDDGDYLLKRLIGYTRELAPAEAPNLDIEETTSDSVLIKWLDIPVDKQQGFIQGFKVYYSKLYNNSAFKPVGGQKLKTDNLLPKIINDSNARTFKIGGLEPGTTYTVALRAYTRGGDSPSRDVTVTTPNSPLAVILGITLPLVGVITLGVILSIFCYRKQEWIKETFYPDIPDPNNSKVLQDGTFLQGVNSCKTLEPKDCTPNEVQVVEEKQIGFDVEKEVEVADETEVVPEDISDTENQNQGVLSYSPRSAPVGNSGKINPAFEAMASPSIYPSEVTYTSIRGPGYQQQEARDDEVEVIVKSGYQPQIHGAIDLPPVREQTEVQELMPRVNGYQPQAHRQSWSQDSGEFPPPETDSIGSPTSINSQAFLIPERMLGEDHSLRPGVKTWSLPFFQNSRMTFDSNDS